MAGGSLARPAEFEAQSWLGPGRWQRREGRDGEGPVQMPALRGPSCTRYIISSAERMWLSALPAPHPAREPRASPAPQPPAPGTLQPAGPASLRARPRHSCWLLRSIAGGHGRGSARGLWPSHRRLGQRGVTQAPCSWSRDSHQAPTLPCVAAFPPTTPMGRAGHPELGPLPPPALGQDRAVPLPGSGHRGAGQTRQGGGMGTTGTDRPSPRTGGPAGGRTELTAVPTKSVGDKERASGACNCLHLRPLQPNPGCCASLSRAGCTQRRASASPLLAPGQPRSLHAWWGLGRRDQLGPVGAALLAPATGNSGTPATPRPVPYPCGLRLPPALALGLSG